MRILDAFYRGNEKYTKIEIEMTTTHHLLSSPLNSGDRDGGECGHGEP